MSRAFVQRVASVLFWSVIAAAFVGPGTVTSAASAGTGYGYALLWALLFSTLACFVLQEAGARLTVVSGRNLGEALRDRYPRGWRGTSVLLLVLGAIVLGCAAYQAGNILGGVAGAALALPWSPDALALAIVLAAAALLFFNSPRRVALLLSLLVATMGIGFLWTALILKPALGEVGRGLLWPSLPSGSSLLAIALVGTTVVPYNLFLGSGLARGQTLGELRFGLAVAVGLGGVISMAVLVVGAAVDPPFSFDALSQELASRLGPGAKTVFALGLFSAGLSSAVTAPLAAAVTARSLFARDGSDRWADRSWRFRSVWGGVLAVGLAVGISGARPVPVILLAQAFNGLLLPLVAVFLLVVVNDRRLMGKAVNRTGSNVVMIGVVLVAVFLGTTNLLRAAAAAAGSSPPGQGALLAAAAGAAALLAIPAFRSLRASK